LLWITPRVTRNIVDHTACNTHCYVSLHVKHALLCITPRVTRIAMYHSTCNTHCYLSLHV